MEGACRCLEELSPVAYSLFVVSVAMQRLPGLPEFGLQAPPSAGFVQSPTAPTWDASGVLGLGDTTGSAGTLGGSVSTLTASGGVGGSTDGDEFQDLAAAWGLGAAPADPATAAFDSLELDLDDLRSFEVELGMQHSGASGAAPTSAGTGTGATTAGRDASSGAATAATAATDVEDKKERQRAQNRAKQARFRQRQKVGAGLARAAPAPSAWLLRPVHASTPARPHGFMRRRRGRRWRASWRQQRLTWSVSVSSTSPSARQAATGAA